MRRDAVVLGLALAGVPGSADAIVLSEDPLEDASTEAGVVARGFGFVMAGDVLSPPVNVEDASPAAVTITDLRPYFSHHTEDFRVVFHQSATMTLRSHATLGFLSLGNGGTPPRWLPLRAASDDPTLTLSTETDWAYGAVDLGPTTLTLGRQPVTLGRGRLFQPWDLVSRFALTQVDTSYKPGVDAVRVDADATDRVSVTAIAAVGELERDGDLEAEGRGSSFVARGKYGWRHGEFSVLGGVVRNDVVLGWGALWTLDDLDLYGEATATFVRDDSLSSPAVEGRDVPVPRGLVGATVRPVDSLTLVPEVYTDGFGARTALGYAPLLLSERALVGEQTLFGRLYGGLAADYEVDPLFHVTALGLSNALDPSAIVSVGATYDVAENAKLLVGGYVPVGESVRAVGPVRLTRSEFGMYPYFGFVEFTLVL